MKYAGVEFNSDKPQPGKGQGMNYPKQRKGGRVECECPNCGEKATKARNVPCTELRCPNCNTKIVGK